MQQKGVKKRKPLKVIDAAKRKKHRKGKREKSISADFKAGNFDCRTLKKADGRFRQFGWYEISVYWFLYHTFPRVDR